MTGRGRHGRGRSMPALLVVLAVVAVVVGVWLWPREAPVSVTAQVAAVQRAGGGFPAMAAASGGASASATPGPPLTEAERQARRLQWQSRLERAQEALQAYERAARYPHESRPASEHPDQMRPFDPVAEDQPLKVPGGSPLQGVRLKTTQERIFLSGSEASGVTLSLVDANDKPLALQIQRAVLKEVPQPGATTRSAEVPLAVNDNGQGGDARALDGIFTAWVQPQLQGLAAVSGLVRLEMNLAYGGQPGFVYFDFVYSPETAARWVPGVREAIENGSLVFALKTEVLLPGRYVASARIDDATGRTFAVALFNAELGAGVQEIRLPVFGKLILDEQPQFPLRVRDVEAFLLKPDAYPDRVMMPRLAGVVHTSRIHAPAEFSDAAWQSEERDRYLAELGRDVNQARKELTTLGP